jgi:hypothetical protein
MLLEMAREACGQKASTSLNYACVVYPMERSVGKSYKP